MSDIFAAMRDALLSGPLAESVTINGVQRRAFVHRGIQMVGDYGQVVGTRTEVETTSGHIQHGDTVIIGATAHIADAEVSDDGLTARFVVRSA